MLFFVHIFHEINLLFQNNCKSMLCVKQYDTIQYAPKSIYLKYKKNYMIFPFVHFFKNELQNLEILKMPLRITKSLYF